MMNVAEEYLRSHQNIQSQVEGHLVYPYGHHSQDSQSFLPHNLFNLLFSVDSLPLYL